MGTNYYFVNKKDRTKQLHIGKSSYGWCFSLHVWTDQEDPMKMYPRNWDDWLDMLHNRQDYQIENEEEQVVEFGDFVDNVENREHDMSWERFEEGYSSEKEFHEINNSERGPNNLLRHKIDGVHCIGHGEGTYDYITGEFS